MRIGKSGFEAQLIDDGLSIRDLEAARQHAAGERMEIADATVALSLMPEADSYASLSRSTGLPLVDLDQTEVSELALRLVSERLARRHMVVPIARRERPDMMLIDLNMPEMDGYEAIAHIRRELTLTTMPIVVLTSEEGPGVERRVLDLDADDYIVKPFDAAVLLSRVHAVFRRLTAAVAA